MHQFRQTLWYNYTMYKATLESTGQVWEGEGDTAFDAFKAIPVTYLNIKNKGLLKLQYKGREAERFMFMRPLRRVFVNKLAMAFVANTLEKYLKGEEVQTVAPLKVPKGNVELEMKKRGRPKKK